MLATTVVVRYAPEAKGSGIPQVLEAIEYGSHRGVITRIWEIRLVSVRTALVKVLSSALGILAGASIGREGPTVQIACSGFSWIGRFARKHFSTRVDFQSYLIAGAATGVAAAFNTPLAGITFALEEITENNFGKFKRFTMICVIIGGITAQSLAGDYLYFGHPLIHPPTVLILLDALLIGVVAGIAGGIFAKLLATPTLTRLPKHWVTRALICGVICTSINYMTHAMTSGSGYEITRKGLESTLDHGTPLLFPLWKLTTTVFSYLSGMAGGIFSPCLSIGAGIGFSVAKFAHFSDINSCALIGMVAFFSGAVQAPLTSVIIVMEMTDERILIPPFMIAALLAQGMGKLLMPVPIYRYLATEKKIA